MTDTVENESVEDGAVENQPADGDVGAKAGWDSVLPRRTPGVLTDAVAATLRRDSGIL